MDKKAAAIAIIVGVIGFINVLASTFGFSPLPIDESMVTAVVSFVAIIIGWAGGAYKNFNFTEASKVGQEVTDAIKDEKEVRVLVAEGDESTSFAYTSPGELSTLHTDK